MDTESILRKHTMNLFNDYWYINVCKDLENNEINRSKNGYVYFIKNGINSKNVKIGATYDVDSRMKSFKTSFDKGVFIIGYIKCNDPFKLEKEFHSMFNEKRVRMEFFRLKQDDITRLNEFYDLVFKYNIYKRGSVELLDPMENIIDETSNLYNIVKSLELNKKYTISDIERIHQKMYGNSINKSKSWIGRYISSYCSSLGLYRKYHLISGVRYFSVY